MDKFLIIKILYAAASIQGLFLAVLLFFTKINQPANKILSVLLVMLSFHLLLVGFDNREFFMTFPHLSRVSWIIGSLYWPLIYWFIQSITHTQPDRWWKKLWPLIPFILFLIVMLPYYALSAAEKRAILDNFEKATEEDFGWINQVISVLHIFFQGYFLLYYIRLEKKFLEEFSAIESVRISWLKQFLIIVLLATVVAVISFFVRSFHVPVLSGIYSFHFVGVVFIFYWLSYKALTNPVIFGLNPETLASAKNSPIIHSEPAEKYTRSALDADRLERIFETIKTALEKDRLFTKSDLTLTELSEKINIPRHQVSQTINSRYAGNFFDLINDYRVAEFTRLATHPDKKHLSLLGISQEAGFNSKASFYAVFKKKTGMTPSEYLETQSSRVK